MFCFLLFLISFSLSLSLFPPVPWSVCLPFLSLSPCRCLDLRWSSEKKSKRVCVSHSGRHAFTIAGCGVRFPACLLMSPQEEGSLLKAVAVRVVALRGCLVQQNHWESLRCDQKFSDLSSVWEVRFRVHMSGSSNNAFVLGFSLEGHKEWTKTCFTGKSVLPGVSPPQQ